MKTFFIGVTYDRFMAAVNSSHENFYKPADATLNIIDLAPEANVKIEDEIKRKLKYLNQLLIK